MSNKNGANFLVYDSKNLNNRLIIPLSYCYPIYKPKSKWDPQRNVR